MRLTIIAITLVLIVSCGKQTSEEHIQSAQQFLEQNNVEAAVLELKNAVQVDPKSASARFELGKVYLLINDFESAEKELNRALEYGYSPAEVIPLISKAYKRTGAYAALSEIDHKSEGLSPVQEAEVGFFKLQSLVQLNKLEEASALIDELQKLDTQSVYKGLSLVYRNIIEQDFTTALAEVNELKKQSPLNTDILKLQGQLLLQQQKPTEAVEVYQEYVNEYPEDFQTVFVLAKLLVDSGKTQEAEPHVDSLLKLNPENAYLNQLKGTIRAAENDFENALKYSEKAIINGRGDPVLRLIAGFSAYQLKDYETANQHLSYIASSLPDNHPGLKMLAASQLQLGMSTEAGDVLDRLNQVSEADALLFSKTGYELIRSGEIKQAKEVIERSELISRTADDLTRLGVLKLSVNDLQGIVDLEKALEQAPEMENTKRTLATAYVATKQWDKATELAEAWKQSAPDDVNGYLLAGEILAKQGQYEDAKVEYNKVLEIESGNGLALLALANVTFLQGDVEKSASMLSDILSKKANYIPALTSFYLIKKEQGDNQAGIQPTLDAFNAEPQNTSLAMLLAKMHFSEKQWQKALDIVNTFSADNSAPNAYWQVKGQSLLSLNQATAAAEHYDLWLSLYPNSKQANVGKMLMLDAQNKFAEGLEMATTFLEKREDLQMQLLKTHFLVMSKDFDAAQDMLDTFPEQLMSLPFVQGFKARILISQKNFAEALPLAQSSYAGLANSRNLVVLLSLYEKLGENDKGLKLLKQHAHNFPNDLAAKMLLAERQLTNDRDAAINNYLASLKLNPNNFVVLNNLAYLYLEQGRTDEAKELATRAVDLRPDNAAAIDTLAQVFVAEEDYKQAIQYYDRIINDELQNEEIYLNYVEVLVADEQIRLAARKLEQKKFTLEDSLKRAAELETKIGL